MKKHDRRPPALFCDICGAQHRSVRAFERDEFRPSAAKWVSRICARCAIRLTSEPDDEQAAAWHLRASCLCATYGVASARVGDLPFRSKHAMRTA